MPSLWKMTWSACSNCHSPATLLTPLESTNSFFLVHSIVIWRLSGGPSLLSLRYPGCCYLGVLGLVDAFPRLESQIFLSGLVRERQWMVVCTIPLSFTHSFIWFTGSAFVCLFCWVFLLSFLSHNCIDAVIVWYRVGILGTGCVFYVWSSMPARLGHGNDSIGDD